MYFERNDNITRLDLHHCCNRDLIAFVKFAPIKILHKIKSSKRTINEKIFFVRLYLRVWKSF